MTWDSTDAKTITFVYSPSPVDPGSYTDPIIDESINVHWANLKVSYSIIERTASSVKVRATFTMNKLAYTEYAYNIILGSTTTRIVNNYEWSNGNAPKTIYIDFSLQTGTDAGSRNVTYSLHCINSNGDDFGGDTFTHPVKFPAY